MSPISYRDIQKKVRQRIQSREWKPGDIIPKEIDLAAEFGCARATINRALRELADTGLLERRRKAGTRVSLNPVRKATLDIPVTRLEIEGRGQIYRHKILHLEHTRPPEHLAAQMNVGKSEKLLHLKTLHLADNQPFCFEIRWINPKPVPAILRAKLETISANEWLVQNAPISRGDIAFSAENASQEDAAALGISIGLAVFVVDRMTWAEGAAVTQVRLAYLPEYRMTTHI